jgi:ATP-dependent DNA helicase RecG
MCGLIPTPRGARIIEGEGGGIAEAQRALAAWQVDGPIFIDKAVSFTAVITRPDPSAGPVRPADHTPTWMDVPTRILACLDDGPLSRNAIAQRCGLTPSQTRYALGKLIRQGRVNMDGGWGARNTTYSKTPATL